jgi:PP-loop superfamily ATP-utilizing enzyme
VTIDRLRQVERAERALRSAGVTGDLRVRYHGDLARVEIDADALDAWLAPAAREALRVAVRDAGFERVAVDVRGFRSGSLNVLGGVVAEPLVRARSNAVAGDADGLTRALGHRGLTCRVESRQRLAVLMCSEPAHVDKLVSAASRAEAIEAARGYGFTHVALDLEEAVADAAVCRG